MAKCQETFSRPTKIFCSAPKSTFWNMALSGPGIREICKDAHVTNGAFYNHFDDKEALFGALVEPVVQEVKAIYEASVNEHMELAKTDDLKSLWKLLGGNAVGHYRIHL